jgi:chromosome condensin MukBEF ATPase and DNA-binding subunit MukB
MRAAVLCALLLACVPLQAEEQKATDAQLLTKQVLELRQRVSELEKQLVAQKPIIDAFELRQAKDRVAFQQEDAAIEADWKTLEAALRKTLSPTDGAVFNRATLTFSDPK